MIELATGVSDLAAKAQTDYAGLERLFNGPVTIHDPSVMPKLGGIIPHGCFGGSACAPPWPISDGHTIYFYNRSVTPHKTVHELAHIIDWNNSFMREGEKPQRLSEALPESDPKSPLTNYATQNVSRTHWEEWGEAVAIWVYGTNYPGYQGQPLLLKQEAFLDYVFGGMIWQ